MDHLYRSQLVNDNRRGLASTALDISQLSVGQEQLTNFRSTSPALPLKSRNAVHHSLQADPLRPYGEAASKSLGDAQRGTAGQESLPSCTSTLQQSCMKRWECRELSTRASGSGFMLDGAGGSAVGTNNFFRLESPTISTAATLNPIPPLSLTTTTSVRGWTAMSRPVGSELSESNGSTTRQHRRSPTLAPTVTDNYGSQKPISSTKTRVLPYLGSSTGTCPGVSYATPVGPGPEFDGSSRLRALSSSSPKLGNVSAITALRSRCTTPSLPAPASSSSSDLRTDSASRPGLQQPYGQHTAAPSILNVESSLKERTRLVPSSYRIGAPEAASCYGAGRTRTAVREDGSSAAFSSASRGSRYVSAHGNLQPDRSGCLSSAFLHKDRQDVQSAASRWISGSDRTTGCLEASVATNAAQGVDSQRKESSSSEFVCDVVSSPRTERVNAFLGFLKELYLDQDLIPASSVVDCLATLASYAQGLPAVQGASLPWCCVGGKEIAQDSTDPVCLKDRVVVKLLSTLMQAQLLACAQVSSEPSESAGSSFGDALDSCSRLGKDPLALVLSVGSCDAVRVNLQPLSECGEPGGAPSLISLGSCSSLALSLSAVETVSRHHMPVGACSPPNACSKVHLCYSSFLRWLWEELCARKHQSEPFDVCTSLIACEACSSSICSEAECVYMLPKLPSLPVWLDSCNIDLAVLLLLSLASRPMRHPLAFQLLERTSFSLDKCSAVGLAAWLRASAVMGLSSIENPAFFGRVLTAVSKQMPQMPLGTVLADVLWGLTLCGIPPGNIFIDAVPGIARNMHMFELEDLCLIGCCYALQKRGFAGVTGDLTSWSHGGHFLPPEFFKRPTGLKAYCLLGCVKIADTGPTPVLSGPTTEGRESAHGGALIEKKAMCRQFSTTGKWTAEELVRAILDTCQGLRGYISLKACRILDFVEKIMEKPRNTGASVLYCGSNADPLSSSMNLGADTTRFRNMEEFHEARDGSCESCFTGASSPEEDCNAASHRTEESGPHQDSTVAGLGTAQAPHFKVAPECNPESSKGQSNSREILGAPGDERTAAAEISQQRKSFEPCETASSELSGSMWGDQFVPAPAALSALHNYGAKAQSTNFPGNSRICSAAELLRYTLSFWGSCASFAAHALFGYFVMVAAIYAFSPLS